jgi:hypothetical protein
VSERACEQGGGAGAGGETEQKEKKGVKVVKLSKQIKGQLLLMRSVEHVSTLRELFKEDGRALKVAVEEGGGVDDDEEEGVWVFVCDSSTRTRASRSVGLLPLFVEGDTGDGAGGGTLQEV